MPIPTQIENVTAITKANIYFDGRVVSHSLLDAQGAKTTLGIIFPGQYHFGTEKAERMEVVAGECKVMLDGQTETATYTAGGVFELPAKSGFDIEVTEGVCEYICTFLD